MGRRRSDHLSYDHLHALRKGRFYSQTDSKEALETRLALTDAERRRRALTADDAMDTPAALTEKRGHTPVDAAENLDGLPRNQNGRCRVDARRLAFVAGKEVVKEHYQLRNPDKSSLDATRSSVVEGVGDAVSARAAEECNRVLGQKETEEEEIMLADLAREANERELSGRK